MLERLLGQNKIWKFKRGLVVVDKISVPIARGSASKSKTRQRADSVVIGDAQHREATLAPQLFAPH